MLSSVNTILHQRQLEEYYCTLCYAIFDLKRRIVTLANSGLPYPIRATADGVSQIELPGVPLGSFPGSAYDELSYALQCPSRLVFCCLTAPDRGGATALADAAAVLRDLPPELVDRFTRTGWQLLRTHNDIVGVRWPEAFGRCRSYRFSGTTPPRVVRASTPSF